MSERESINTHTQEILCIKQRRFLPHYVLFNLILSNWLTSPCYLCGSSKNWIELNWNIEPQVTFMWVHIINLDKWFLFSYILGI